MKPIRILPIHRILPFWSPSAVNFLNYVVIPLIAALPASEVALWRIAIRNGAQRALQQAGPNRFGIGR